MKNREKPDMKGTDRPKPTNPNACLNWGGWQTLTARLNEHQAAKMG